MAELFMGDWGFCLQSTGVVITNLDQLDPGPTWHVPQHVLKAFCCQAPKDLRNLTFCWVT